MNSLFFQQSNNFGNDISIIDNNDSYTYLELDAQSELLSTTLLQNGIKKGDRVAFIVAPGFNYVVTLWAIWKTGGVAVPLCISHPSTELEYVIDDSSPSIVVYEDAFFEQVSSRLKENCTVLFDSLNINTLDQNEEQSADLVEESDPALILYTSGTTGKPKGVVHTHQSIQATIISLTEAWRWSSKDHILHTLPLHHTHGIVNILLCALYSGATCEFIPKFNAKVVFQKFLEGNINLFMAVPTIYSKLIEYWEGLEDSVQHRTFERLSQFRLMVSGSAALPVSTLKKWEHISGHILLERYGMTEIGMAISNPYDGTRKPGYIGQPLPGVSIRLVDENNEVVKQSESGEIQVQGATLFKNYWRKEKETKSSFSDDGWFKTGDIAVLEDNYYKILGRNSVDIIKSGGYKISALEIEEVMRTHEGITECAVVGIPHEVWGEVVSAAIVSNHSLSDEAFTLWAKNKLAPYKIPKNILRVDQLPKNALGKVVKPRIKDFFKS